MTNQEIDSEIYRINRELWHLLVTSEYRDFKAWMPKAKSDLMDALEHRIEDLQALKVKD